MSDAPHDDATTGTLRVVRLLQNPLGHVAPPDERDDLVRVSNDQARVYLLPHEFDTASPATLRRMLAQQPRGAVRTACPTAGGR